MNGEKELIEELASLAGCVYMSDLHTPSRYLRVSMAVDAVERGRYGAAEWREAYHYITGKELFHDGGGSAGEEAVREAFKRGL